MAANERNPDEIPSATLNAFTRVQRIALAAVFLLSLAAPDVSLAAAPCEATETVVPAEQPAPADTGDAATASAQPVDPTTAIVVTGAQRRSSADPLETVNEKSYAAVQAADRLVVAPISLAYEKTVPSPLRDGIHNVLYNLREPVVIANFLLQHRIGKAGRSLARLAINSTIGVGGLFDFAKRKPFKIPFRRNGFANTLGFYGIKPGPYMYLPIVGSTTLRDLVGTVADRMFLSLAVGPPFTRPAYRIPVIVLGTMDDRLVNDVQIKQMREQANAYVATRNAYLTIRAEEIAALHHPD
ncbi:VacJ family lipoprotein [Novosphingobium sp. FSW06-99]|uniref:MlaA family lipoprotein n=1 Tax=Novosphingobium sp. FSW06-99 TaxID=1739113 RepID=UPI000AFEE2FD|nr:VacJ family lipoprotein [Novosphingobium sp. FSW06-99]